MAVALVVAISCAVAFALGVLTGRRPLARRLEPAPVEADTAVACTEARHDTEIVRRGFELEMARALEHAQSERDVLELVRDALSRFDPDRPFELHLVDASEPVLRLAATTQQVSDVPVVTASPWTSIAARTGKTLTYESTEQLDACPHLRSRVTEPCSAVCVPLTAMGRILGVLYATGPEGVMPTAAAVASLELVARTAAAYIAVVRAFAAEADIETDVLTGLPDRRAAFDAIRKQLGRGGRFSVALCDADRFRGYNAQHTDRVGDAALRLLAEVICRALRPQDLIARHHGDQFLLVLADVAATDAAKAAERIREMLVITQATRPEPAFTVSFGVADSSRAKTVEELLREAGDALELAKRNGRNRVVVAGAPHPGAGFPAA